MVRDRASGERRRLQSRLLDVDPQTGIDRRVLSRLGRHGVRSHQVAAEDGTRLSVKEFGHGDRVLVLCNGLGGTYRTFAEVLAHLLPGFRVVVHDYRGLFESGIPHDTGTLGVPHHARDVLRVMDSLGIADAVLLGWSMGVQVALEAYRQRPERFRGLVCASGVRGGVLDSIADLRASRVLAPLFVRLMRTGGDRVGAALAERVRDEATVRLAHRLGLVGRNADVTMEHLSLLLSAEPGIYWRIVELLHAHDVAEVLPLVEVPSLVLHGDRDLLTPVRRGRELRTHLPDAEMHVIRGGTHALILEHPAKVAGHVSSFLERRVWTGR